MPLKPSQYLSAMLVAVARANKLGLKVKSSVLLSTEVISKFDWDGK